MKIQDICWQQRFASYQKALSLLTKFIDKGDLSELEAQGLIKAFEYTYELGWKTLKDYLNYQGYVDISGSRDTIRTAFQAGLIADGEGWMDMLYSRNRTVHTYQEETAQEIVETIFSRYFALFQQLRASMQDKLPDDPHHS